MHPIDQKTKRVYVSWKKYGIKNERQAKKSLTDKIDKIYDEWYGKRIEGIETFGDLVDVWYDQWVDTVRQTTRRAQMKNIRQFIFPVIPSSLPLENLTKTFINNARNKKILKRKTKKGDKPIVGSSLQKIRSLIRQITYFGYLNGYNENLKFGKRDLTIPDDRFIEAETKRLVKWLTQEEVRQLIFVIKEYYQRFSAGNNRYNTLHLDVVEFLTRTGLRIGELGALNNRDVNFSTRKLTVNKTLVSQGFRVEEYEINAPKSKSSYQIINLDRRCIDILRNRIEYNRQRIEDVRKRARGELFYLNTLKSGPNKGKIQARKVPARKNFVETEYIFQLQAGNPIIYSEFNRFINEKNYSRTSSIQEMMVERYPGWNKYVTIHTFRYTHISYLAEKGVPLKAIMNRVGHKNSKTTLEIYNQVTEQMNSYLINALNGADFD